MRKKMIYTFLPLSLGILFFESFSYSQECKTSTSVNKVTLDFKTKKLDLSQVKSIKNGELYSVEISNINMNLFNVQINHKDSTTIVNVGIPSFEIFNLDSWSSLIKGIYSTTIATVQIPSPIADIQNNLKKLNDTKRDLIFSEFSLTIQKSRIERIILQNDEYKEQNTTNKILGQKEIESLVDNISDLDNRLDLINFNRQAVELEINKINSMIEAELKKLKLENERLSLAIEATLFVDKLKESILNTVGTIRNMNSHLANLNRRANSYLFSLYENTDSDNSSELQEFTSEILVSLNQDRDLVQKELDNMNKLNTAFAAFAKIHKEKFDKDSMLSELKLNFEKRYSESILKIEGIMSKTAQDKIHEFRDKLIHLENNKERTYLSIPYQCSSDISKLEITISPKKPEYGQVYKAEYIFPLSKMILGVSGGFYYGFGIRNDFYSVRETQDTDTTSSFNIVKEDEQKGEIGFASLLHIGYRPHKNLRWLGYNFVIGPAVSFAAQPQVRLTLGGGVAIGERKSILSINGLWMHGYTQKRSNVFQEDMSYSVRPEQITVSRLTQSFGLSIGYIYKF